MNFDQNTGNTNWTPPEGYNSNFVEKIPNATGAFVLGIISVCISTLCCCCYGSFAGVITSIIGIVLGNKAVRKYQENPDGYSEKSYKKAKTGRTLSWIGLVLSILVSLVFSIYLYLAFTQQLPPELQDQFDENMRKYDFN